MPALRYPRKRYVPPRLEFFIWRPCPRAVWRRGGRRGTARCHSLQVPSGTERRGWPSRVWIDSPSYHGIAGRLGLLRRGKKCELCFGKKCAPAWPCTVVNYKGLPSCSADFPQNIVRSTRVHLVRRVAAVDKWDGLKQRIPPWDLNSSLGPRWARFHTFAYHE